MPFSPSTKAVLNISCLFTISLGKEIGKESEKEYSLIPIEKHTNKAPLSYAQERLWFSFQEPGFIFVRVVSL
jgi:hypothetical protein